MASSRFSLLPRNTAYFQPHCLTPRTNVMRACVATVPAVMGATSINSMRRRELSLVAPVRGWIVAAWARTLAPKKRHRFQKLLLGERGRQFVGDKGLVELATLRPMLPDITSSYPNRSYSLIEFGTGQGGEMMVMEKNNCEDSRRAKCREECSLWSMIRMITGTDVCEAVRVSQEVVRISA